MSQLLDKLYVCHVDCYSISFTSHYVNLVQKKVQEAYSQVGTHENSSQTLT